MLNFEYSKTLEVKFHADGELGLIEGVASPFNAEPDAQGDIIAPGAFARCLAEKRRTIAMLWMHDKTRPIGRWLSLRESQAGLEVRGMLNLATEDGSRAFEHVRGGSAIGLSIGFAVKPNGLKHTSNGRILTDIDLFEISLVSIPAAPEARISGFKGTYGELFDRSMNDVTTTFYGKSKLATQARRLAQAARQIRKEH